MPANDSNYSEANMLIRKPVSIVFEAMIEPEITTNFWFTKSSGSLQADKEILWEWEMYKASSTVIVHEVVTDKKLKFEWNSGRIVEFKFEKIGEHSTYVSVIEYNYQATHEELIAIIRDSTGGFTTVLDGMKAYLEHGIKLNLIADKFPTENK